MAFWHFYIVKNHFGRVRGVLPHLVKRLARANPLPIALHHKTAHPVVPVFRAGVGKNGVEVGNRRPGDKRFVAVQQVMIPHILRRCLNPGHVRPRLRLGEAVGSHFARHQTAAILLLLRLASGNQHRQNSQPIDPHGRTHARASPGQLLGHNHLFQQAQPHPAIFFGDIERGQPQCLRLANDRPGVFMGAVIMFSYRGNFITGKLPRQIADHRLLFSHSKTHRCVAHYVLLNVASNASYC